MAENCKFCEITKRICSPNCPFPALFNAGVLNPLHIRRLLTAYTQTLIDGGVRNTVDEADRFIKALFNEIERRMDDIVHGSRGFNARLEAEIGEMDKKLAETRALIEKAEADLNSSNDILAKLDLDIMTATALLKDKNEV